MELIGGPKDGHIFKYPPKFRQTFWFTGTPNDKTIFIEQNIHKNLYQYDYSGNGKWKYIPKT